MRQRSDTVFAIGVAVVALLAAGIGVYWLGSRPDHSPAPAAALPGAGSRTTDAGAIAATRRNFALTIRGEYAAACAMESPAYLRFDAQHYLGGCRAGSRDEMEVIAKHGLTARLSSVRIVSSSKGRATVLASMAVGGQLTRTHVYLQRHRGRWWITGGEDSGDVGY